MKYTYKDVELALEPIEFNKDSGKEILQYAVGGLLYMPASNNKIASKIINREYDFVKSMVLDLEDSLGDDMIELGQSNIQKVIDKLDRAVKDDKLSYEDIPLIFIRIRESGQMEKTIKMLGDNAYYISGFNVPKFDMYNCDDYIKEFTKVKSKVEHMTDGNSTLYIMPIIENKTAIYRQLRTDNLDIIYNKLKPIQDSVLNIRVGGADFCSVYGLRRGIHDNIYEIDVVRSVLNDIINVFGRSYVVSGPVWEYFENKDNPEDVEWLYGLERELYYDRLAGILGKTSIHPSQLPVIQKSLVVSSSDYNDALKILGMNPNTTGVVKGATGNRMNEVKTHTNWAKKIISLASIYGVKA